MGNYKLLHAAKYALRAITEEGSPRRMTNAQELLYDAIKEAEPEYYYTQGEQNEK